jgi:hypothetical protein
MKRPKQSIYRIILFFSFGILLSIQSSAAVSTYNFSQSSGTYTAISGGTVLGDTTNNDNSFTAVNIGFTFYFNGKTYTQAAVNTNGYIAFGSASLANSYTVISDTASGSPNNLISALNYDLQGQTGSVLRYRTTGTSPNRTFIVQWTNYKAAGASGDDLSFQIRLSETSNNIVIRYDNCTSTNPHTAQVGLRGNNNTDFNNRYVADTAISNTWSTSAAGTLNSSNCIIKTGFAPASGQTYTWQPVVPASPATITFTNVGYNRITVNWNDNSINEDSFLVYLSTDNINFTLAGSIASSTKATTGTGYSLPINVLLSSQLYYFKVYALENTLSNSLNGNQSTLTGILCGTYSIGPTGDYSSITLALDALINDGFSCSVILELQSNYDCFVEAFPIVVPFFGCDATRTLTLRPATGATNLVIATDSSKVIDLYGATWFTIDGRAGGTGSTRNLSIIDSSTAGNAIRFAFDAQNNTLKYLNLKGATKGNSSNGVVRFFNGRTTAGNSDNTITHCDISKSNSSPQVLLYSNTNIGFNANNTITNNNFHDWFVDASGNTSRNYGINLGIGNTDWTISTNSFYQTTAQVYTLNAETQAAINISGGKGNGFTISGNFIGGSAPNASGTWTINYSGTGAPRFNGISINADTLTDSEIQGNTIKNISLTTAAGISTSGSSPNIFNGISVTGGNVNVGNSTSNTIGSLSSSNSIVTTASANGTQTIGINSTSTHNVTISDNNIGGIFAGSSTAGINTSITGILASAGNVSIVNNTIGGSGSNNLMNAPGDSTGNSFVTGISVSGNNTTSQITDNLIRNLTNQYTGFSNTGITRGISILGGVNNISTNIIENLSNKSPQSGSAVSASVQGISQQSTSPGQTITNNVIRLLSNKSVTSSVSVTGIFYTGALSGTNIISKNRIYGLGASLDTSVVFISGIEIAGGNASIHNNMISIGTDTLGASYTKSHQYVGILKNGSGNNNFYYNSVNIAGSSVLSKSINTFAFRRTVTGTDTLRNNIFANTRSNLSTGGSHYSIALNDTLTINSQKNNLFGNGNGYVTGLLNNSNQNSLFNWYSAANEDLNSLAVDPDFQSVTNLHINNASGSPLESQGLTIAGLNSDIDGQVRPGPAGSSNGGASAPDIGADEFDGIPLTINMGPYGLIKPGAGCHTASDSVVVSIKNYGTQSINFVTRPCSIYVSTTGPNPLTLPVKIINTGTLAVGATLSAFIDVYDMSIVGKYFFNIVTTTSGDTYAANDTLPAVEVGVYGGVLTPSSATICSGLPITLSLSGQTIGASIQWQQSTNGTTWTPISGAINPTLTVSPGVQTYYQAKTCGILLTTIDTIDISNVADPVTADTVRCGSGPVNLHASFASEVAWFDSLIGGTVIDTGLVLTKNVSASGTYYASAIGNISANKTDTTTFFQTLNTDGNMFTITTFNNVIITGFDGHSVGGTNSWGVYYRKDNFLNVPGSNTSSNGWIFVDSVSNVVSPGAGLPTTIPFNMSILIPAGKTYSFYVMTYNGTNVYSTTGSGLGNANTLNSDFQIEDGYSGPMFNCTGSPHIFNGIVHYKTGCLSNRVAANFTVNAAPSVNAATSSSSICEGDSTNLTVTSANLNYSYSWTPTQTLSSTTGNSVWAHPVTNSTYYVQAYDAITGCLNNDTLQVAVTPLPVVNLGINTTACGSLLLDAGNTGDTYLWNDNSTNQTLSIDTTGSYYVTVTHLGTCSATDSIDVVINPLPVVTFTLPFDTICIVDGIRTLSGGSPANGSFSGTAVTGNDFDPAAAGSGYHIILYTYVNPSTTCSNSSSDSIYVDGCATIKDISNKGLVSVYPNPLSGEITIDLSKINENCKVDLFNLESKLLASWEYKGGTVYPANLGQYANGMYFLKISTANSNYLIRLIKQN